MKVYLRVGREFGYYVQLCKVTFDYGFEVTNLTQTDVNIKWLSKHANMSYDINIFMITDIFTKTYISTSVFDSEASNVPSNFPNCFSPW